MPARIPRAGTVRDVLKQLDAAKDRATLHRPLFVTRFPNGIGGKSFYQKHWDDPPPFARTVAIYSSQGDTDGDYLVCENLATLLWLGQMASLEAGGDPWNGILEAKQDLGGILGVGGAA
jgi:bifunctional non-homologous end joining protein LigD